MRHVLLSAIAAASLTLTACADGEPTAGYTTTPTVEYTRPVPADAACDSLHVKKFEGEGSK